MRALHYDFVEKMLKKYKDSISGKVLEIGAAGGNNAKKICEHLKLEWVGIDLREEKDITVMDAHNLEFEDESIGAVISITTLEHIHNPIVVAGEIRRILKKGGFFILSVPYKHIKQHGTHKGYGDYWRFTPLCIEEIILKGYDILIIQLEAGQRFVLACGKKI